MVRAAVRAFVALAGPVAAEEWSARNARRTDGPGPRCIIASVRQPLPDGYQTRTAYVTVDDCSVAVTSGSNLDPGVSDIALVVDQEPLVPMDRLAGPKTAHCDSKHARPVELFKAGARLRAEFRFWPEWPATKTHSATLSLSGFTRADGELAGCR